MCAADDSYATPVRTDDRSEREQAEKALGASEERFHAFMDHSPVVAFVKDETSRYVYGNRAWAELLGRPAAELIGRTDDELWPADVAARFRASDHKVLVGGAAVEFHESSPSPRGGLRHWVTHKFPLHDAAGRLLIGGLAADVTEQKRLEEELRQAHKLEAIGQLAGGVAHDFNNLLTIILGHLELVQLPENDPARPLLAAAAVAAQRAADLTAKLLGYARRSPLQLGPVRVGALAEEVAALLRHTIDPRIQVQVRVGPDAGWAEGDAGLLHQVLLNLCLNARDAMPKGGTLALSAVRCPLSVVRGQLQEPTVGFATDNGQRTADNGFVRLTVADTGCGMSEEVRRRVFEPFFTTKEVGQGTGLGLAMAYGIVQQHRGWVECKSAPGRGTRFDVYLPRASPGVSGPLSVVSCEDASAPGPRTTDNGRRTTDNEPSDHPPGRR